MRRAGVGLVALALVAVLAGCTGTPSFGEPDEPVPSPFQPCPAAATAPANETAAHEAESDLIPDLTLPCFVDATPVSLRSLGRPAVINLWASSCGPCRKELPALQRFADAAGDQVIVLGVDTNDTRDAAAWAGSGFGASYPSLFDPEGMLLKALGRTTIPITLFVDATGVIRHLDRSGALTLDAVIGLAFDHLGVST